MSSVYWMLIVSLATGAFAIRVIGLLAGNRISRSRHRWVRDDLPGLIVISLVATSLAGQSWHGWVAAAFALAAAVSTNHVLATMCAGMLAYAVLSAPPF